MIDDSTRTCRIARLKARLDLEKRSREVSAGCSYHEKGRPSNVQLTAEASLPHTPTATRPDDQKTKA